MISPARLLLFLAAFPCALAQIGDRSDKAGEVQKSLVPADKIPPAPALTPEQALKSFTVAPGFKLELAATEPLVQEPVAIAFAPDGRMFVVEMRGYMPDLDGNGEDLPTGRVSALTDTDGDGRYDRATIFADNLVLPRAIAFAGDGVLVGAPPELIFFRDTDGDGKADTREIVATDYGVRVDPKRPHLANPERAPNSLLWAFDNWIYSAAYTKKFRRVNGAWETAPTTFRGQWGLTQDDAGRLYYGSNSDFLRVDVIFADYLGRNPNYPRLAGTNVNGADNQLVWPARVNPGINRGYRPEMLRDGKLKEFTAACGWWIYRGDLLPELAGNLFVAEPSGNFVRRAVLKSENGTVRGRNAYADEQREFIASTDERFRPVSFATGPDGALYIVDLYRGVLQHRISLTSYLRKQSEDRGLNDPQHLGRIYRVVPDGRPAPRVGRIAAVKLAQWVEKLSHPNAWWRETAQRVLVEARDPALTGAVRAVALHGSLAQGRVHALAVLDGAGALDRATVLGALKDESPLVRAAGLRLAERFLPAGLSDELVQRMAVMTRDESAEVVLQAVLSLGQASVRTLDQENARVVREQAANPFLGDAFLSGLKGRELVVLEEIAGDRRAWPVDDANGNKLVTGLARGLVASRDGSVTERIITMAGEALAAGASKRAVALLDGLIPTAGMSRRPIMVEKQPPGWSALEKNATAKARLDRLKDVVVWPGKPGVATIAATAPLTPAQAVRFEQGRTLFAAVCSACHQANGRGLEGLAPPLLDSEWVLGTPERTVRIVLNGVRGPITVLGKVHTGDMPGFGAALNDEQIASILTYVRREWGHTAAPVEPALVAGIRSATAGHTDAWSPEELNLLR
ncbi:MAG: c-type cytochrome [Opitutaceae bacterium]|nr:c-type cytochrome [Opitutaceae bacterium]